MAVLPSPESEADIAVARAAMAEASRVVLAGFELRTDMSVVCYPHRYMDGRGRVMWDRVCKLVIAAERDSAAAKLKEATYG
jgi:hypothetical protein